ncbi:aromatic prenyltransferase [Nocardia gamkensis]|uniref:aromatic prenyltransferase n=1 Tax=Nocardia gamkensis TaxID=352869 RepID=UPI0037C78AFE
MLTRSVISLRVVTDARRSGDLDYRFLTLPSDLDPYGIAVSNELVSQTDHPVDALLEQVRERCPIHSYGIDIGVVGGFKKIWPFFPPMVCRRYRSSPRPDNPWRAGGRRWVDICAQPGVFTGPSVRCPAEPA